MTQKRRVTELLLDYWEALRAGRDFPAEPDVNPDDLKEVWESCFLVHVTEQAAQAGYKYTYLGRELIDAYGENVSNLHVSELYSPGAQEVSRKFDEVVAAKTYVVDESEFRNSEQVLVKYRQILLPLSSDGSSVDYILGGMKWKGF